MYNDVFHIYTTPRFGRQNIIGYRSRNEINYFKFYMNLTKLYNVEIWINKPCYKNQKLEFLKNINERRIYLLIYINTTIAVFSR